MCQMEPNVMDCEGSDILPYKLACHRFTDAEGTLWNQR